MSSLFSRPALEVLLCVDFSQENEMRKIQQKQTLLDLHNFGMEIKFFCKSGMHKTFDKVIGL